MEALGVAEQVRGDDATFERIHADDSARMGDLHRPAAGILDRRSSVIHPARPVPIAENRPSSMPPKGLITEMRHAARRASSARVSNRSVTCNFPVLAHSTNASSPACSDRVSIRSAAPAASGRLVGIIADGADRTVVPFRRGIELAPFGLLDGTGIGLLADGCLGEQLVEFGDGVAILFLGGTVTPGEVGAFVAEFLLRPRSCLFSASVACFWS